MRASKLDDAQLYGLALESLAGSWATHAIAQRLEAPDYDRAFGHAICRLAFAKAGDDLERYRAMLRDFMALSEEFVLLQIELDETKRYRYANYAEVRAAVYDNPEVMDGRYLSGLLLSQAFWINHMRLYAYFRDAFCGGNAANGSVLEVPCGTGIYISEFAKRNPGWTALGADLSESSAAFAREIVRLNGTPQVTIERCDVFELAANVRFDRIVCGELLEHLEEPERLLEALGTRLAPGGRIFLTTAIWAANIDHIFLFESAGEVRAMLARFFTIESELVVAIREGQPIDAARVPLNYAAILGAPGRRS